MIENTDPGYDADIAADDGAALTKTEMPNSQTEETAGLEDADSDLDDLDDLDFDLEDIEDKIAPLAL